MTFDDLPEELRDAIYIEDCHVSGEHNPNHTNNYVCSLQYIGMAKRILTVLGVNFTLINDSDADRNTRIKELNKIPRRINRDGVWYKYYKENEQYKDKAQSLEEWERNGLKD